MKAIFLDVDGVLNRCHASGFGLEAAKLTLLDKLVRTTGAALVLSSSWRNSPDSLDQITAALENMGHRLHGCTPDLSKAPGGWSSLNTETERHKEIAAYLATLPECRAIAILDDMRSMGPLSPYHVRTKSDEGLTPALMDTAVELLTRRTYTHRPTPTP